MLEEWNPLGDASNNFDELDGYRYEAIDIISTIDLISGPNKAKKVISQVLTEAFNIELDQAELAHTAKKVEHVLGAD